jgi:hypothetical protein
VPRRISETSRENSAATSEDHGLGQVGYQSVQRGSDMQEGESGDKNERADELHPAPPLVVSVSL